MISFLSNLGLSVYDIALLFFCPLGAALGAFSYCVVDTIKIDGLPISEDEFIVPTKEVISVRTTWMFLRLVLAAILGLIIGSIQETPATLAKLIALLIILGFSAPKLWLAQEKVVDSKTKKIIEANFSKAEDD